MNYLPSSLLTLLVGLNLLTGCGSRPTDSTAQTQTSTPPTSSEPLDITVSVVPQEYFVEKIGGDRVKVNVMVGPGDNLHIYEPKPQQLKALSQAEAYVSIGVPFEKALMGKIFTTIGLWLSYFLNLTSGATITLVAGIAYLLSLLVKQVPKGISL